MQQEPEHRSQTTPWLSAKGTLNNTNVYIGYIDHKFRRDCDLEGLEILGGDLNGQWLGQLGLQHTSLAKHSNININYSASVSRARRNGILRDDKLPTLLDSPEGPVSSMLIHWLLSQFKHQLRTYMAPFIFHELPEGEWIHPTTRTRTENLFTIPSDAHTKWSSCQRSLSSRTCSPYHTPKKKKKKKKTAQHQHQLNQISVNGPSYYRKVFLDSHKKNPCWPQKKEGLWLSDLLFLLVERCS